MDYQKFKEINIMFAFSPPYNVRIQSTKELELAQLAAWPGTLPSFAFFIKLLRTSKLFNLYRVGMPWGKTSSLNLLFPRVGRKPEQKVYSIKT